MAKILGLLEIGSILLIGLGAYVAFGPYHDDRTWNLMRNSADIKVIKLPSQEPTHFRLYALSPGKQRTTDPALLFVPGHGGSWKQGINLCAYLAKEEEAFNFYVADFHASASALHWTVLSAQASFTAAAIQHLAERHAGPKILLGHSMGGRVALEALLVDNRRQDVDALILISTPTESHPLLLEPRFAPKAYNLSQTMDVYALSGGATDPLVPMRSCHIARDFGRFIPLPAASNVYSSFSHVNLLFSRHSLHFLTRLLRAVATKTKVPVTPWLRLGNTSNITDAPLQAPMMEQEKITIIDDAAKLQSFESWPRDIQLWKQPKMEGVFSFLLLEEPRKIRRRPESTTRGETFYANDVLNCSEISALWRHQASHEWYGIPLIDMHFPAKVCLFQVRATKETSPMDVLLVPSRDQHASKRRRMGWAHWHEDPIQAPEICGTAPFGIIAFWFQLLWNPLLCRLPSGRALVTRIVLPLPQLPLLPLDFRMVSRFDDEWLPPVILFYQADQEEDVRIATLEIARSTKPSSPRSWAAESADFREVFTPRLLTRKEAFSIFVIGHPDKELILEVRGNIFSSLAELLRTQHFHTWLGACTSFSAADISNSRLARRGFPLLWASCTVLLEVLLQASTEQLVFFHVLNVIIGLGLASASRRFVRAASAVCQRCRSTRSKGSFRFGLLLALLISSVQPSGFMLLLLISCIVFCDTKASPLFGTSSLLLGPHLLCQLQSLIFAVWLLLGQQKEASAAFLQSALDETLSSSQHAGTLWADSWLMHSSSPVQLSLLAPTVTLFCSIGIEHHASLRSGLVMLILSIIVTRYAAPCSSRLWWACQPVFIAHMLLALASRSAKQAKLD